jgi:hypothetical protein
MAFGLPANTEAQEAHELLQEPVAPMSLANSASGGPEIEMSFPPAFNTFMEFSSVSLP